MKCQMNDIEGNPDSKKLNCCSSVRASYVHYDSGYCYVEPSFINSILGGCSAAALVPRIQFAIRCTNACGCTVQAQYRNRNIQLGRRKWLFRLAWAVLANVTGCQILPWNVPLEQQLPRNHLRNWFKLAKWYQMKNELLFLWKTLCSRDPKSLLFILSKRKSLGFCFVLFCFLMWTILLLKSNLSLRVKKEVNSSKG